MDVKTVCAGCAQNSNKTKVRRRYIPVLVIVFILVCFYVVYEVVTNQVELDEVVTTEVEVDEMPPFSFEGRKSDDPALVEFIRSKLILPPEPPLPYNLVFPGEKDFSKHGQGKELKKIFGNMRNGFFIEAGGFTGEDYSPTLFWERENNWTGILIEPHPYYYSLLAGKNRKAIILNAGISPTNTANQLTFSNDGWGSKITPHINSSAMDPSKFFSVPCFPITSVLSALDSPTVDLFSLDVETYELPILRTMNLSALNIHVFLIECLTGCRSIQRYMERHGYKLWTQLQYDGVYVKKGIKPGKRSKEYKKPTNLGQKNEIKKVRKSEKERDNKKKKEKTRAEMEKEKGRKREGIKEFTSRLAHQFLSLFGRSEVK